MLFAKLLSQTVNNYNLEYKYAQTDTHTKQGFYPKHLDVTEVHPVAPETPNPYNSKDYVTNWTLILLIHQENTHLHLRRGRPAMFGTR